jgi:hypothetical protein
MRNPMLLVILGAALYLVGFALGSNDIDPASAIIGTAGAAVALIGLVWAAVIKVRGRATA